MKPMAHTNLLIILTFFTFLSCKSNPSMTISGTHESDADRQAAFNQFSDALYPIKVKDKWGFINRKGETMVAPSFDEADDFNEGAAKVAVTKDSQFGYGFIDQKGQWLVQPIYQKADRFAEGLAVVAKDDLYGYVDMQGKEVILCQFEDAGPFHKGYAAIKQEGWTGFINKTGTVVIKPAYTVNVNHPMFVDGIAPVFGADEQTGFIDTTGQWYISAQFESAGNFVDGLAWAMWQQDDSAAEHGFTIKGGYIDKEGVYVIPPEYDFGWDFSEGYATVWVRSEDKQRKIWKVIDKTGMVVLDNLNYRNVGALSNGLIPVQDENMMWGFMNIKGEIIISPQYAGINHFKNGLARMEVGTAFANTIVYINMKGEIVWNEN